MDQAKQFETTPSPVQVAVQSKFMQNYRIAAAVNAGSDVVAIPNRFGQIELFSIGSDGAIWNFCPDPTSGTGYRATPTGLTGTTLAVGKSSSGSLIVFSDAGTFVTYVSEINRDNRRWSAPIVLIVTTPPPHIPQKVVGLYSTQVDGTLYVAALTKNTGPGPAYNLSLLNWSGSSPTSFSSTSLMMDSTNCIWSGISSTNLSLLCVGTTVVSYKVGSRPVPHDFPIQGRFAALDVAAATDAAGNNHIYAVLQDGNIYELIKDESNHYSWKQINQAASFTQVAAATDDTGLIHLFGVATQKQLYHWQLNAHSPTGFGQPMQIQAGVGLIGVASNDGGAIDVFAVAATQGALTHLYREADTGNWAKVTVEVPSNGSVEEMITYSSDISLTDSVGAILAEVPVNVTAAGEAYLTINGATYTVGPNLSATVVSSAAGIISVALPTGSLAAPIIEISVPSLMTTGPTIAIQQNADIQATLAALDATQLLGATDTSGQYILSGSYRTPETAASISQAINHCMALAGAPPGLSHPMLARQKGVGVWYQPARSSDLRHIRPVAELNQHWQLSFQDSRALFRALTADDARELAAEKSRMLSSPQGVLDWLSDIGDFIAGVGEGVVDVLDIVVTAATNAAQAVITFVTDGVTYVFNVTVSLIEQAFDLVETVLAQVAIKFEKVFQWLGFLFSWPDILRTHEAVAYTISQFMEFLSGAAGGIQTLIDGAIAGAQQQVASLFDQAVQNIAGTTTILQYEQNNAKSSPNFTTSVTNNIVYNNAIVNASSAVSSALKQSFSHGNVKDPVSALINQLEDFATQTESSPGFNIALQYFQSLGKDRDQIATQTLAGLLRAVEGLVEAALAGAQTVVDALLELLQSMATTFQELLNAEWDIPFVSDFYSWLTNGSPLTTLNLAALILAVPTTLLYKVANGAAPFPDEASVTAFRQSFSGQIMVQTAGLETGSGARPVASAGWSELLPQNSALLLPIASAMSQFFYGSFSAILDAQPPPVAPADSDNQYAGILNPLAWLCEASNQVCSFPWFVSAGSPGCGDANARGRINWIYGCIGVALDAVFIVADGAIPENKSDIGVIIAEIYGVVHLIPMIAACVGASSATIAANVFGSVPECCKLLRLRQIVAASEGASLGVIAGIDGIFSTAAAIAGYMSSLSKTGDEALPGLTAVID